MRQRAYSRQLLTPLQTARAWRGRPTRCSACQISCAPPTRQPHPRTDMSSRPKCPCTACALGLRCRRRPGRRARAPAVDRPGMPRPQHPHRCRGTARGARACTASCTSRRCGTPPCSRCRGCPLARARPTRRRRPACRPPSWCACCRAAASLSRGRCHRYRPSKIWPYYPTCPCSSTSG